ncbi:hypothetical protein [Natrinema sp. DC36]|nr:hypothetical protein [Natrinema sp. DC36]
MSPSSPELERSKGSGDAHEAETVQTVDALESVSDHTRPGTTRRR